jgi:hypothetical protein
LTRGDVEKTKAVPVRGCMIIIRRFRNTSRYAVWTRDTGTVILAAYGARLLCSLIISVMIGIAMH